MKTPWSRLKRPPPYPLRKAWSRFLARLPARYQRSILRFEHFVVLGPPASGKSWIIERYSDWRRQAQQFLPSQPDDPDLPVYLGSSAVMIEVPSQILHDHTPAAARALDQLFRPLYQWRAPTVVVVLDAARLREATPDALDELGGALRGKINLIAAIRRRPVEVRVALTHLDAIEGYRELAALYRAEGIPLWITLAPAGGDLGARLDAWMEEARAALPRALTSLGAAEYRRVIAFLRQAPALIPPLHRLLAVLLAREALSPEPIPGGLYLGSDPPGVPSPLRRAAERGLGHDPRVDHLLAAASLGTIAITLMGNAFVSQHEQLKDARDAITSYDPKSADAEKNEKMLASIARFTSPWRYLHDLDAYPPFFIGQRRDMRRDLSFRIRDELLIPNLHQVAEEGRVLGGPSIPYRRSLYYLRLIHGDRRDVALLSSWRHPDRVEEPWPAMTGLKPELIVTYLLNTDEASKEPIELRIAAADQLCRVSAWKKLFDDVATAMADGSLSTAETRPLSDRAQAHLDALDLLDQDSLTRSLISSQDGDAVTWSSAITSDPKLASHYEPLFEEALKDAQLFEEAAVTKDLRDVLGVVRVAGDVEAPAVCSLHQLTELLEEIREQDSSSRDRAVVSFDIGEQQLKFEQQLWGELVRASKASRAFESLRRCSAGTSIFFEPGVQSTLQPIEWNPFADADAVFTGTAALDGRYTRKAYAGYVLPSVKRLSELLGDVRLPDSDKHLLASFVRAQVKAYAESYLEEVKRFILAYGVNARSPAALRVALAQMSSESSSFDDFLIAVDTNTRLDTLGKPGQPEPMLEPIQDLVVEKFARWHGVVGPEARSSELKEYKAILAQMLQDPSFLARTMGAAPRCPSPQDANARAALAGEQGSYPALLLAWLDSVDLPAWQRAPFLAPLCTSAEPGSEGPGSAAGTAGSVSAVEAGFRRDLLPELKQLVEQFPFNRQAQDEVEPAELAALLHPQKGRLHEIYGDRLPAMLKDRSIPWRIRRVLLTLHALSGRLWDQEGNARPVLIRVFAVAPACGEAPCPQLTVNVGGQSLPLTSVSEGTLPLTWQTLTELKICLSESCSGDREQVTSGPSYWSLFNLLRKGNARGGGLYTWEIGKEGSTSVGLVFPEDPWGGLDLRWRVRSLE